jgi:hypothetical protein
MSLDQIANSVGTLTDEQQDDTDDRVNTSDFEERDIGNEYEGGWDNDH